MSSSRSIALQESTQAARKPDHLEQCAVEVIDMGRHCNWGFAFIANGCADVDSQNASNYFMERVKPCIHISGGSSFAGAFIGPAALSYLLRRK